jgi:hypothetical protein
MDMSIAEFSGYTITMATVITAITEALKQAKRIPGLGKLKFFQWLCDSVAPGRTMAIRCFVAFLCVGLSLLSVWYKTGIPPTFDTQTLLLSFTVFFESTAAYSLMKS